MSTEGFFRSRWVDVPDGVELLDPAVLAPGFRATGIACGIKKHGGTDVGVVAFDGEPGPAYSSSVLLTKNAAVAAPVQVCRDRCDLGDIRAVVVNSGNANAATGQQGYDDAVAMQETTAGALGIDPSKVAVAETGTIGIPLEIDLVIGGIAAAAANLEADGGKSFTRAIMTTDIGPKQCTVRHGGITLSAQAKGAGMIEPGFATMLCFIQTDAVVEDAEAMLRQSVDRSFERITVDGQMSTNDTVVLQASGSSGLPLDPALLDAVLLQLALEIVADGEGATRSGLVEVFEAESGEEAEEVARAIANSPLVKTALYGRDPNWGRIAQAAGQALIGKEVHELTPEVIDAEALGGEDREATISIRLGRGDSSACVYFSDLSPGYVDLNSQYTT